MDTSEITPAAIRFAAMNYLAQREQSAKELYQKLVRKYSQSGVVAEVIQCLKAEGLQSDQRFAEAFVAMRKRQGKGPLVIAMELRERGLDDPLIQDFLDPDSDSWALMAIAIKQKKYGPAVPLDAKEKARQIRFLSSRGFSSQHIRDALKFCGYENA